MCRIRHNMLFKWSAIALNSVYFLIDRLQHSTKHQLYGHLPPIMKTIQVRRTKHAGHCLRSKDELISDVLLWTPSYGRAKAGRLARRYIQQLCEDTGCSPEDLPEAMNDREEWRERVRDIRAGGTTWWWWWYSHIIQIHMQIQKTNTGRKGVWKIELKIKRRLFKCSRSSNWDGP